MNFLDSANGKLFVVFDEAHHAAAPSYRRLIENLREKYPRYVSFRFNGYSHSIH